MCQDSHSFAMTLLGGSRGGLLGVPLDFIGFPMVSWFCQRRFVRRIRFCIAPGVAFTVTSGNVESEQEMGTSVDVLTNRLQLKVTLCSSRCYQLACARSIEGNLL